MVDLFQHRDELLLSSARSGHGVLDSSRQRLTTGPDRFGYDEAFESPLREARMVAALLGCAQALLYITRQQERYEIRNARFVSAAQNVELCTAEEVKGTHQA